MVRRKKKKSVQGAPCFTLTPQMIAVVQKGLRLLEQPLEHADTYDVTMAFAQETMVRVKSKLTTLLASAGSGHTTTFDYNEKVIITSAVQLYSLILATKPPNQRRARELRDCYLVASHLSPTRKKLP